LYYNGELEGWVKEFYENGSIKREEFYQSNTLVRSKLFSEDGNILSTFGYD